MDVSYIEHLLNKAKHRFKVFVTPNHEISSWTIDRLYDLLKENKTKKLKSALASIELYNMADTLALASFYDHCLVEGKKREARWVRHCLSGKEKVNFLGPIDGIRGNLEGLKQIATSLDCDGGKIIQWFIPLPVAYGLLSQDPKTIHWCLSSFFRAKNIPNLTFETRAPQAHIPNVLFHPLVQGDRDIKSIEFFDLVLQEKDKHIQNEILSCVQYFDHQKVRKNFNLFWFDNFSKIIAGCSPKENTKTLKNMKKAVASLSPHQWSDNALLLLLESIENRLYTKASLPSEQVLEQVLEALSTLKPLFTTKFKLMDSRNLDPQKSLWALLFAVSPSTHRFPDSLEPLTLNEQQNMSLVAQSIYNTHMLKHSIQQNLNKNESPSCPRPPVKKKM